ncbi:glycyl-radical enzyme activating protein [bacterium]|nr:glycyl-radical enzyme activating protein [bacterium]
MSDREGIVYNIQRFSVHDGPGIRTTVFLKGCPLNCAWCSNPESQQSQPQLMIRDIKCSRCGECISACPSGNVSLSEDSQNRIMNWGSCQGCFQCVAACVYQALTVMGETMTVRDIMEVVESDRVFYKNSKGGVTFSGGEPLLQIEFLVELMTAAKKKGFHTALDTTGLAPAESFRRISAYTDLVLFDIKHLDSEQHYSYTGVSNRMILENIRLISRETEIWIRIPLVAGINDDDSHIADIAALACELGIRKISLLPYHEGGVLKRKQLGMQETENICAAPGEEHINYLSSIITGKGLIVGIGS